MTTWEFSVITCTVTETCYCLEGRHKGQRIRKRDLEKEYIDFDIADGQEYAYELSCFDFAGNVSDKVQVVLRTETPAK